MGARARTWVQLGKRDCNMCVCVLKRWKREGGGISRDVYVRCRVIAFVIPAKGRVGINRRLKGILICSDLFRKMVK